ncbi:putative GPI inositol-deacylase [Seiridium cardinale]|uniref:GPI inositol-deacylase n=1 Tax=Seiridium cardinale TaxID=138064 RepID=A0ABR2Y605_9PEZI
MKANTLTVLASNERDSTIHLEGIRKFLGVSIISDERYESLEGSCGWLQKRDDFREWREELEVDQNSNYTPWIYWVTAGPGAGKSVLASHVGARLEEFQVSHAFHHFHAGNKSSQSLARCLRLMAYQMASSNAAVREVVAKLSSDGTTLDQDDARAVWLKLFKTVFCRWVSLQHCFQRS